MQEGDNIQEDYEKLANFWRKQYCDLLEVLENSLGLGAFIELDSNYTPLVERIEELKSALKSRQAKGHNDTCAHMLLNDYECDCGWSSAQDLLLKFNP